MNLVIEGERPIGGHCHKVRHISTVALKQLKHNFLLVGKVVIQVAGAYLQLGSDMIGGNIPLPLGIKQPQAGIQNSVSGFHMVTATPQTFTSTTLTALLLLTPIAAWPGEVTATQLHNDTTTQPHNYLNLLALKTIKISAPALKYLAHNTANQLNY